MNRKKICWLAAVVAYATTAVAQIEKVNPVIGTDGMGHTFPGACVPFGMIQFMLIVQVINIMILLLLDLVILI